VGEPRQQVADHSDAIRGQLAEGLDAWSAVVTELVAEGQRTGEISPASDPAQLGRFIVNAWEGALTRSRVVRNGQPIDDFFRMIFGLLLA
jgi:TetR/AcrR family transcriptional regulator, transcriptional repressor for nem operon